MAADTRDVPKVVHCKKAPKGTFVYVGRPSVWGNPWSIDSNHSREAVIKQYRDWLLNQPKLLAQVRSLRGKNLGCWCAPKPCHADVLLEIANG